MDGVKFTINSLGIQLPFIKGPCKVIDLKLEKNNYNDEQEWYLIVGVKMYTSYGYVDDIHGIRLPSNIIVKYNDILFNSDPIVLEEFKRFISKEFEHMCSIADLKAWMRDEDEDICIDVEELITYAYNSYMEDVYE